MELHPDLPPPPRGPKFDFLDPLECKPERVVCISERCGRTTSIGPARIPSRVR